MVPTTLRLRNFMSYGDQPVEIDFQGLHLACLSGANGHGKSALLDAITWALWGRSRAKREDDLVRQGAAEMEVELCFGVGGGQYRVLRKRVVRSGRGTASLELQALSDGAYTAITGGTIAETQARLTEILKLSYETFINSTFLLQGRADEFTVKPPAQRKEVLGEILGLDRYDELTERARARARAREDKARGLREGIAEAEKELARRPALQSELDDLARARREAEQALHEAELAQKLAHADRQALAAEERNLSAALRSIAAVDEDVRVLEGRRDAARRLIAEADELLADEAAIGESMRALQDVRAQLHEMGARAARAMERQADVAAVEREIESAAAELRAALRSAEDEATAQERTAREGAALHEQVAAAAAAEARIPVVEAQRAEQAGLLEENRREIQVLEGANAQLEAEMKPLRERLKLLGERGAACPVCGSPMNEEERARVVQQFKQEGLARDERKKANAARITELSREAEALAERDKELAAELAGLTRRAREAGRLRQLAEQARTAAGAAQAARERAAAVQSALDAGDFAHEARARLAAAHAALQEVGYDPSAYAALRQRGDELAPVEARFAALETARVRRDAALETVANTGGDLTRRQAELAALEQSAAAMRQTLAGLPALDARVEAADAAVRERRVLIDGLTVALASNQELLRRLDEQQASVAARRTELAVLESEGGAYAELAHIFGKKGIQAMIIDDALPELERRANDILTRMSDGEMQVQFATQAQGAKGDLLETLDIRIADASGTRPYEMFSGGEAFRANFAIRIALSGLLAERAGAQLQMLVIDEGFGSQDSQGRERLVGAINSIADDFEKIMVVTHIDELKDLFNARIDVIKDRDGSRVLVTV